MAYVPYKKGTVLIPTGGTKHLFVILTDKCPAGEHLLVNVSSIKPNMKHDTTCIVNAGEHRFITKDSYVEYRRAEIIAAARLSKLVDTFVYTAHDDVTDDLLLAIRDGVEDSPFTARRILNYFKNAP